MTHTAPFLTPAIFNLGPPELIAIALVMLLLFGSRLPSVMRNLGRGVTEFKKGIRSTDDDDQKTIDPPATPPTEHSDSNSTED